MKNILIIGVVIIALVIAWFVLNPGDANDYVVTFEDEVAALEAELVELDASVEAGTLTPEQATVAKVSIMSRLATIETSAQDSERIELTPAQRTQLSEGLERLKNILVTYQATLAIVEETADDSAVEAAIVADPKLRGMVGSGRTTYGSNLTLSVASVIDSVEETVQDSVQDYETDETLDEQVSEIVDEVEAEVEAVIEEVEAEMEEATSDEATSTQESETDSAEMSDEATSTDADTAPEVEVEAEAEIETTL